VAPVTAYGNVVTAAAAKRFRPKCSAAAMPRSDNQTFKLKKGPLTYFPAPDGVRSTLQDIRQRTAWNEVATFFGAGPDDQVYIVRQNDGRRVIRHSRRGIAVAGDERSEYIVAYTASARARPARPAVPFTRWPGRSGIASVKNPRRRPGATTPSRPAVCATYAPASALLLGRATSIPT